jgi:hypothetical protein
VSLVSRLLYTLASVTLLLFAGRVLATPIVLYDQTQNETPDQQPWLYYAQDGAGASQSPNPVAGVDMVTDTGTSAGYANQAFVPGGPGLGFKDPGFPVLDSAQGFTLGFELTVHSESHASNDRAGFSVILLDSLHRGVELGFWDNEIWAQNDDPLFTHGDRAAFDTGIETLYELTISGAGYLLETGGSLLLQGALMDYSAFGGAPYSLGSFVFLGDDTGSAGAETTLGRVTIETGTAPEPPLSALLLVAWWALWWTRRTYATGRAGL